MQKCLDKLKIFNSDGHPRSKKNAPLLRSLCGEVLKDVEETLLHPINNEIKYRKVSSAPIMNKYGQIIGAVAIAQDCTEHTKKKMLIPQVKKIPIDSNISNSKIQK